MKYKMIVSDFDDTLIADDLRYSENTQRAIREYTAVGGRFVIATGRMLNAILPAARALGLKGEVLAYQGAIVGDIESGAVLEQTFIDTDVLIAVLERLEQNGFYIQIYVDETVLVAELTDYSRLYEKFCMCPMRATGMPLSRYVRESGVHTVKIVAMGDPKAISEEIDDLNALFGDRVLINTSKPFLLEVVSDRIDKGKAVLRLAERYGIRREETICVGDSANDVPMLRVAGLGAAVANASEVAKSNADVVVPSNNEDGVAYVIDRYGLEKPI